MSSRARSSSADVPSGRPNRLDLPPLLVGHRLGPGRDAFARAVSRARDGRLGAGDLVWIDAADRLEAALVMEPEVPRERCAEMVPLVAVAFGDALGAIAPPEIAVTYLWPDRLLVNGAEAGRLRLALAEGSPPAWLVIGLTVAIRPDANDPAGEPGRDATRTNLWDEGCGDLGTRDLLAATARHTVATLHGWEEDGFGPIHRNWTGRHADEEDFVALDDHGNALVREGGATVSRDLIRAMT